MIEPGKYAPRDDGMFDVGLPNVGTVSMALSEEELQQAGLAPYQPPPMPMAGEIPAPVEAGPSAGFSSANAGPAPKLSEFDQAAYDAEQKSIRERQPSAPKPEGPKKLVSATGGAGVGGLAPPDRVKELTEAYALDRFKGTPAWSARIPERDVKTTFQQSREIGPSADARESMADASIDAQLNMEAAAQSKADRLQQHAETRSNEIKADEIALNEARQRNVAQQEEFVRRRQGIQARRDQWQVVASQPFDYWKDRGALAQVTAGIMAALGTFAASAPGGTGRNFADETIDQAIDREWQARNEALQNNKTAIDIDSDSLAQAIAAHGDPKTAELEFKLQAKDIAAKQAEMEALRSGSAEVMENFKQWQAEWNVKRAEQEAALDARMQGNIVENFAHQQARTIGGGGRPNPLKAMQDVAAFNKAAKSAFGGPVVSGDARELTIPGEGYAYSKVEAAKLREAKVGVQELKTNAELALQYRDQVAKGKLRLDQAKGKLKSLNAQSAVAYKQAKQMGALDKGTQEVWENVFGNPDKFFDVDNITANAALREFHSGLDRGWNAVRENQITRDPPTGTTGGPPEPVNPAVPDSFEEDK